MSNNEGNKDNEGSAIKTTYESENVIIVHESLHNRASAEEISINNNLSVETETNLALEMLDTVLEAEEINLAEREKNSPLLSNEPICDTKVQTVMLNRQLSDEKCIENNPVETINHNVTYDSDYLRDEIDAILEHARKTVEGKLRMLESEDDDDENIFKNRKFLSQLSNLISKSSHQAPSPQIKPIEQKPEAVPDLKHSKSAPDLKLILDTVLIEENSFNDDTNVDYVVNDFVRNSKDDDAGSLIPPPPIFSAELFQKVATLKRTKKFDEGEKAEDLIENTKDRDESEESTDETLDKENFRDKLEKLLRVPPSRLSLVPPVPLPRKSLIKTEDEKEASSNDIASTPTAIGATMKKQRVLFDEVLKKIKRHETEDNDSSVD